MVLRVSVAMHAFTITSLYIVHKTVDVWFKRGGVFVLILISSAEQYKIMIVTHILHSYNCGSIL